MIAEASLYNTQDEKFYRLWKKIREAQVKD